MDDQNQIPSLEQPSNEPQFTPQPVDQVATPESAAAPNVSQPEVPISPPASPPAPTPQPVTPIPQVVSSDGFNEPPGQPAGPAPKAHKFKRPKPLFLALGLLLLIVILGGVAYAVVSRASGYKSVMQKFVTDVQNNDQAAADALQSPQMNSTDKKFYGNASFDQDCHKLGDFCTPLFKESFLNKATKRYSVNASKGFKYEELTYTLNSDNNKCKSTSTLTIDATDSSGKWLIAGAGPGVNFNCNLGSGSASTSSSSGSNDSVEVTLGGKATNVPFGTSASDGTYIIKVVSVEKNPTVTGDQPDPGTQYVEVDFSITSVANKNNYALNLNYAPSIPPTGTQVGDTQLGPVDSFSGYFNPLTGDSVDNSKNVTIPGKQSIEGNGVVPADGTAQTVQAYGLYETAPGDKGYVAWDGVNNKTYDLQLN